MVFITKFTRQEAYGGGGGAYLTDSRFESNTKDPGDQFYEGQCYLFMSAAPS